jgi:hypothetical protein
MTKAFFGCFDNIRKDTNQNESLCNATVVVVGLPYLHGHLKNAYVPFTLKMPAQQLADMNVSDYNENWNAYQPYELLLKSVTQLSSC